MKKVFIAIISLVILFETPVAAVEVPYDFYSDSNIQFYDPNACEPGVGAGVESDNLQGSENAEKAFNYFVSAGWSKEQAAGIVGNLEVESSVEPQKQEGVYDRKVPSGSWSGGGWGIAQWTPGSKFINPTKSAGKNPDSLQVQLETIDEGLQGKGILKEKQAGDELKTTTNVKDATEAFQGSVPGGKYYGYERPASRTATIAQRTAHAKATLRKFGGGTASPTSTGNTSSEACGVCSESSSDGKTDVVLDPGHSPTINSNSRDSKTGLYTTDYTNTPEQENAFKAAERIKKILEEKDYSVAMTKGSHDEKIDLAERAAIGNKTKAKLMVTIHSNGDGATWLGYPDSKSKRKPPDGRKDGKNGLVYPEIIDDSKKHAEKMAPIIKQDLGYSSYSAKSFNEIYGSNGLGGNGKNIGNTPVQTILSSIPEVYSEVKGNDLNTEKFAESMAKAITETVEPGGASNNSQSSDGCGAVSGDLASTVKAYAWSSYHPAPYIKRKPAWAKVVDDPDVHFPGGSVRGVRGIDCGGFVTMTIRNSGVDPNYNRGKGATGTKGDVSSQWGYLEKYWEKVNVSSTSDLQPGDVAMRDGHTFLHVGQIDGFNDVFASASYTTGDGGRAPMAGQGDAMTGGYSWYRKK